MWSGISQIRYTDVEQPTVKSRGLGDPRQCQIHRDIHREHPRQRRHGCSRERRERAAMVPGKRVLGSVMFISRMAVLTDTTGQDRQKRYLRGAYTPSGSRPNTLIDGSGAFFSRSRPQYETYKDIRMPPITLPFLPPTARAQNSSLSWRSDLTESRTILLP
ncbi:hypothetical protein B0H14DRAFT_1092704 [Mycena olivaceomarginata]|nr:hypothetical protein B0H14DRAFT_1092704 [Mycena olivaceomarginata]